MSTRRRVGRKARKAGHGIEFAVRLNGRRVSRTFHDRKAGELWVHEMKAQASRGSVGLPQDVTFAEAFERFLRDHGPMLTPATRSLYRTYWQAHLAPKLSSLLLSAIHTRELQAWVAELMVAGQSSASVHRILQLVHATLAHAVAQGLAAGNPCSGVKKPRITKVREVRMLTDQEQALVLAACTTPRLQAMVRVALGTGLRLGELMALEWRWIDWAREIIRVPASIEAGFVPKGKTERDVPLFPDVAQALRAWLPTTDGEGRVFTGGNWRRWAAAIRRRTALSRAQADGLDLEAMRDADRRTCLRELAVPFRWHILRHTFISRLVMQGARLRTVQAVAGHASIQTTMRYSHLAPDALDDLRARFADGILAARPKIVPIRRGASRARGLSGSTA